MTVKSFLLPLLRLKWFEFSRARISSKTNFRCSAIHLRLVQFPVHVSETWTTIVKFSMKTCTFLRGILQTSFLIFSLKAIWLKIYAAKQIIKVVLTLPTGNSVFISSHKIIEKTWIRIFQIITSQLCNLSLLIVSIWRINISREGGKFN